MGRTENERGALEPEPWRLRGSDPFGIETGLNRLSIREHEIPDWFAEIAGVLEKEWSWIQECSDQEIANVLGSDYIPGCKVEQAKTWRQDARQDHDWRLKLLNADTAEGSLYHALARLRLDKRYFQPETPEFRSLSRAALYWLDLEEFPDPSYPPWLREPHMLPGTSGEGSEGQEDEHGIAFHPPMEGIVIPRRYGRLRAQRVVVAFLDARDKQDLESTEAYVETAAKGAIRALLSEPESKSFEGTEKPQWVSMLRGRGKRKGSVPDLVEV